MQYVEWDGAWTTTSISNATIADGNFLETGAISLNQKVSGQVGIKLTFGATVLRDVIVYVLRDVNGSWETPENAFNFSVTGAASETHNVAKPFSALEYSTYKIRVVNNVGSDITGVTVSTLSSVIESA